MSTRACLRPLLNPMSDWAISGRGKTYRAMERYEQALADFDRAIELDPKFDWAIAGRGETYRLMQRYGEALADFDRALTPPVGKVAAGGQGVPVVRAEHPYEVGQQLLERGARPGRIPRPTAPVGDDAAGGQSVPVIRAEDPQRVGLRRRSLTACYW